MCHSARKARVPLDTDGWIFESQREKERKTNNRSKTPYRPPSVHADSRQCSYVPRRGGNTPPPSSRTRTTSFRFLEMRSSHTTTTSPRAISDTSVPLLATSRRQAHLLHCPLQGVAVGGIGRRMDGRGDMDLLSSSHRLRGRFQPVVNPMGTRSAFFFVIHPRPSLSRA